jgi:hypothetical protein
VDASDITGATLSAVATVTIAANADVAMTQGQHAAFTTINATGDNTVTFSDATTGQTADAAIERYVLASGTNNITAVGTNTHLTGNDGADTFIMGTNVTGTTIDGGAGTSDTITMTDSTDERTDLDLVTNVESITLGGAVTAIETNDTLVANGSTLTVNASSATSLDWDGALESDGIFNITGSSDADTIVGGAGADTISGGTGIDTITGGGGSDDIDLGTGDFNDIYIMTGGGVAQDAIENFSLSGGSGTDNLDISLADLNAAFADMQLAGNGTAALQAGDGVAITQVAVGAYDMGGTATAEVLQFVGDYNDTSFKALIVDGGGSALTTNNAWDANDAFLALWDDGTDSYLSAVSTTGALEDGATWAEGTTTVTNLITFEGIADSANITDTHLDII